MKERPILFSGAMVRALLSGDKTQTRRVVKDLPPWEITEVARSTLNGIEKWLPNGPAPSGRGMAAGPWRSCPCGQPSDRLWVKETFYAYGRWETRYSEKKKRDEWHFVDMTTECDRLYQYDTGHITPQVGRGGATPAWHKRPSIFMPRAAARILLEITSVRVERLQDISEKDALAEGAMVWAQEQETQVKDASDARHAFMDLWESINGPGSWEANPWVWVVDFLPLTGKEGL